jgi:hypothetical protein
VVAIKLDGMERSYSSKDLTTKGLWSYYFKVQLEAYYSRESKINLEASILIRLKVAFQNA